MHTSKIKVCNLELFDNNSQHFWIGELNQLDENFPEIQKPHKNDFYTIIFVNSGLAVVSLDNSVVHLDEARIIIIPPGCVNTINLKTQVSGKIICFSEAFFSLRYNNNILSQFDFLTMETGAVMHLSQLQKVKISNLVRLIQEEFVFSLKDNVNVLRSYTNIILYEIERLILEKNSVKMSGFKLQKIKSFEKLIKQQYVYQKLPSHYASILNISPNYLNKLCKQQTGLTAGGVIRKQILIESQRQLRYTNLSINEIADQMGFESSSYFVTFFKKQMEFTPEQFRKSSISSFM